MAQIIPLSEGSFTVDGTKKFVPFDGEKDHLQDRPHGSLLVEIQPFLVITERDYILLDTGLGFYNEKGILQLHENLIRHGVNPADITKVLMSQLHKDHVGGIGPEDRATGERALNFRQAVYYVNRDEFDYAIANDGKSYHAEDFSLLGSAGNVVFTKDDGNIDDYIHYEVTGGHCPYHQVFRIVDGDEIIFFGGDVAPQVSQMKNRFAAKYDYDGRRSMQLRQEFAERGKAEGWTFLYYHDTKFPYGRLS
jgi:glyoxylase-like metal-dependent hydrolase (beta-lactamase superfamily II)